MAEVGGAILSAVIQVLVESLASPLVASFFQSRQVLVEKLDVKLRSANKLLNDAEDKQVKDENIKKWVDDLNEVLNEADNAIDKINTEALRCEIEGQAFWNKIIPTSLDPFERAMKEQLEEIIGRLELILGEAENLSLKAGVPSKRLSRSPAPLIEDPSDVYGRDDDKKAILELLFSENSGKDKISVIPIVGMGGVGKTTLARLVYNDSRVKNCFEHRAWVTVSDDFDVLKIAKLVLEGLCAVWTRSATRTRHGCTDPALAPVHESGALVHGSGPPLCTDPASLSAARSRPARCWLAGRLSASRAQAAGQPSSALAAPLRRRRRSYLRRWLQRAPHSIASPNLSSQ